MPVQWKSTNFKGVRYYEHPTRKHGVGKDKYFAIRYQRDGKRIEEGIGWTSELDPKDKKHWTVEKVALLLAELKEAAKGLRQGPSRLLERRTIDDKRKAAEQNEQDRLKKDAITFDTFFTEIYLPQVKADRPKSSRADEGLNNSWLKSAIGPLPFSQISPFHIEKLKKTIADAKRSPRTIEYALAIVRQVFNYARRVGVYSGESPTAMVKRPKIDNARMRYLTPDEADCLLKALAVKSRDVHDMALLSLHCGLRYGEIAGLQWQDVNLDQNALAIRDAKGGSRTTFLTGKAKEMLSSRTSGAPSDYVFPARGTGGKKPTVSQTFFRVVKEMGFNKGITDRKLKVNFHTLRHSHGTLLYEATHDLYLVQKSLGHKTGTMAQRYAKMTESRLRDAAAVMNQALQTKKADRQDQAEAEQQVANLTK